MGGEYLKIFLKASKRAVQSIKWTAPFDFGAPEGTRTHTLKAREPKGHVTSVKVACIALLIEIV